MLLDQRRLDFAYKQIVQDAAKARGACTVLVFVAPNCDAMCACRIFCYMLRADAVAYKIKPVAGYGDIAAANEDLIKVSIEIRSSFGRFRLRYCCSLQRVFQAALCRLPQAPSRQTFETRLCQWSESQVVVAAIVRSDVIEESCPSCCIRVYLVCQG